MSVDEPRVERILPGQRLAGEAVRLSWQSEEGRERSRHVGRSGQSREDSGGVEAGEGEAGREKRRGGAWSWSSSTSRLVESFELLELV